MAVIYWMNLFMLGLLLASILLRGNVWAFLRSLGRDHLEVWTWLARAAWATLG
jgi:hypothetical protein